MLSQTDVVTLLAKNPNVEQHIAFQIIAAYVYSKSSRGNLPSETLAKVLSIQRKLVLKYGPVSPHSPRGRAFDAIKTQLLQANRNWLAQGPLAFGPLGQVGAASNDDARSAWTKATDGKVKVFREDDGPGFGGPAVQAIDAGRIVGPGYGNLMLEGPPEYVPPAEPIVVPAAAAHAVSAEARDSSHSPSPLHPSSDTTTTPPPTEEPSTSTIRADGTAKTQEEIDLEAGRAILARLRQERIAKEAEEQERLKRERERPLESPAI
ncbi:hypothetical protein BCR35DRAFT_349591 [Leucosporidium creatinivorum]|uniref:Uncharacterized protein n=1 Tax=Leucosporidium creatinivorum TaxID=106004 RepID=A0A1Y2G152_9BASI|nr:hypothetical protein BCR35DRAFT_349591 [Leucosporidium creatinivorum]